MNYHNWYEKSAMTISFVH